MKQIYFVSAPSRMSIIVVVVTTYIALAINCLDEFNRLAL